MKTDRNGHAAAFGTSVFPGKISKQTLSKDVTLGDSAMYYSGTFSFDCPVCVGYLEDLPMSDCGCRKHVCRMCGAVLDILGTPIDQVLYRNGIYSDLVAFT